VTVKYFSMFSGIGGFERGLEQASETTNTNFECVGYSEIDKHAIQVTQKNYPNTMQLGDINNWESWDLEQIDLLIGGSPCQGFSFAGKQLNFNDPRSALFFKYVLLLRRYMGVRYAYPL